MQTESSVIETDYLKRHIETCRRFPNVAFFFSFAGVCSPLLAAVASFSGGNFPDVLKIEFVNIVGVNLPGSVKSDND